VVHWALAQTYRELSRHEDAVREMQAAADGAVQSAYMRAWLAHALASAGRREDAEAIRRDLTAESADRYIAPFLFALMASGFGERDSALEWLERARAERSGWVPFLPVEPELKWLRDDPRFQQLQAGVTR
jgi:tetratricopeptide (TPR) repeat protein